MVDLIVRQYRIVAHEDRAKAHVPDMRPGHGDAAGVGHAVRAIARRAELSVAGASLSDPLLLGPTIDVVSRADLHVLQDDVGRRERCALVRDGYKGLFVIIRAER